MGHSCRTLLWGTLRTRLPPKLTCQSLQNEHFVRVKRKHPLEHTHTHHAALPSSFASPAPPNNTRSHANPTVTATFTSTTTHDLTIPCACHEMSPPSHLATSPFCHENRTSTPQNPHKVLRLPRKVTISSHVRFNNICTSTRSEHTPIHQNRISAETCHENRASMPHPETQIPMARPHPTPQKHDSPNANPNGTAQQSADLTKRCACAAKCITLLARHVIFMQITME